MKEKAIKILDAILFDLGTFWFYWLFGGLFGAVGVFLSIVVFSGLPGMEPFILSFIFSSFCFVGGYGFAACLHLGWG